MAVLPRSRSAALHFQVSAALSGAANTTVYVPPWSVELSQGDTGTESIANSTGTATAGAANTLTDGGKTWSANVYDGSIVRIVSGTGAGQANYIASNTGTVLTCSSNWVTNPDATSVYRIEKPVENAYFIVKSIYLDHLTTAGTVTLQSRNFTALGGTAGTTTIWLYNSGAATSGNRLWNGTVRTRVRGSVEIVLSGALTGNVTIEGFYSVNESMIE